MQLRRLDIVGFKSFANKSTFLFDGNITVLAGPNGSGKSNVAEAVRWVLGEQRPSALRSRRADEVIFLGSDSRAPVGMAEVSLVLDNSEGRMGMDFGEIRVTRRIYRSSDSEYLLNGRKVRLRDITERMLAVGLGPDNYTVIGQGAVDEMIAQKPEERRIALENAADVRRHQIQLNETRNRLATTQENLTRCRDVLAELDPQVRRMRSHADRASHAREVKTELQGVSRRLYRHQYRAGIQRRATSERRQAETAEALRVVEEELASQETRWRALEAESESLGQDLTRADQLVRDLRRRRDALQGQIMGAREEELRLYAERRAVLERQERLQRERDELVERSRALEHRLAGARDEWETAQAELEAMEREEREKNVSVRARRDELVSSNTQLAQLSAELERGKQNQEAARQRVSSLQASHAAALDEIARHDEAVSAAQREADRASEHMTSAQTDAERIEAELNEADREIGRLDADLQQMTAAVRAAEQEQSRLEAARASLEESLERLVTDAAGATLRRADRGVLGVLGPSLRVREGFERMISAALADRVGYVVMAGSDAADELARRVSDADERAALVLAEFNDASIERALTEVRKAAHGLRLPEGALLGFASDVTECEAGIQSVVRRYLGCTLMVDERSHALQAAEGLAASPAAAALPWQVVSRDGHVLRWNGEWRTGSDQRQVRLVAGRAELAEIERRMKESLEQAGPERTRLNELEAQRKRSLERRTRLRGLVQEARDALNRAAQVADASRRSLARAQQLRAESASRHFASEAQLKGLHQSIESGERDIAQIQMRVAELESQRSRAQDAVEAGEAELSALRERLADLQRAAASAEALVRSLVDEQRRDERLHADVAERLRRLSAEEKEIDGRVQQIGQSSSERRGLIESLETELPDADQRLESLLDTMNQISGRRASLDAEVNEVRGRLRQAQTLHDAASLELNRTVEDLTRLEGEIVDELEDLDDEHGVQMALALDDRATDSPMDVDEDPAELQRDVRRLKRELARLGPVDDAALSEYQELIDRHEFLTQQSADLERASESLKAAMTDLEALIQDGLDTTLAEVNSAFQRTFERLFQGGQARLVWSDPESPIASGIDIVAQPPGKRLQPLGNFSGGERALASVALVFALLQVNPTPFCVLDEVDAALDESNVGRFAEIIREWSARTQFIVVTHNRNTMEIADSLFGISMDTHGVSRVVSLRLDQVLAAAEG